MGQSFRFYLVIDKNHSGAIPEIDAHYDEKTETLRCADPWLTSMPNPDEFDPDKQIVLSASVMHPNRVFDIRALVDGEEIQIMATLNLADILQILAKKEIRDDHYGQIPY